jgi:RNA polymerase sigma factor (TIGR02999 family)
MAADGSEVTRLLLAWSDGYAAAGDALMDAVYGELRRMARGYLRRERASHSLPPTALVHEAYLKLVDQQRVQSQNRAHFFGIAAQMMRRILVDHARRGKMAKRSGRWLRVMLDERLAEMPAPDVELLDLDAAITRLSSFDPRKSHIAELRFFGGLSLKETSHVLGLSIATVERDWQAARAWLFAAMKGAADHDP